MPEEIASNFGFFLARLPVFTREMAVFGYQLLATPYFDAPPARNLDDPEVARGLLDLLGNLGLNRLVGEKKAFIPVSRRLLAHLPSPALPASSVVLQLLRDMPVDERMQEHLGGLVKAGYGLALDGVNVVTDWVVTLAPLTQTFIVPIHGRDPIRLGDTVARLRMSRAKILAGGVETGEELSYCQRIGYDFYQGFFFMQPRRAVGRRVDSPRLSVMRSLAMIQDPRSDFPTLGKIIAQDAMLSHKLLGMVNSLSFALPRPVATIEQAVAYMGLNQLRGWMTVLTMASIPGKPGELTSQAILRAKMCELLAPVFGQKQGDAFFVVGLFSVLDALLDLPMQQAIANIPMEEETIQALVNRAGPAGQALQLAMAYERCDWQGLLRTGIKPEILSGAYLHAVRWATELAASVGN